MSQTPLEADDIQRVMRHMRAELREDALDLAASARGLRDWQAYVRSYPWLCLGAAAAAGYFLVPSRMMVIRPDTASLLELAKQQKLVVKMDQIAQKPSMVRSLAGMAAGTLMQVGMALVTKQMNQFLASATHGEQAQREGSLP